MDIDQVINALEVLKLSGFNLPLNATHGIKDPKGIKIEDSDNVRQKDFIDVETLAKRT